MYHVCVLGMCVRRVFLVPPVWGHMQRGKALSLLRTIRGPAAKKDATKAEECDFARETKVGEE